MAPTTQPAFFPLTLALDKLMPSRKEKALEYRDALEREFLNCELRLRIYLRENDQKFYTTLLERKRGHLERVAARERIPTILTDAARRADAEARLYGTEGLPKFYYRDYSDEDKFAKHDRRHYFQAGKELRLADGTLVVCAGLTPDGQVRVRPLRQRHARTTRHALHELTRTFSEPAPPAVVVEADGGLVLTA